MANFSLKRLFALAVKPAQRSRRRPTLRLGVEALENRLVPSTLHVGSSAGEYHTIESAVLAANPGDTIKVDPGTYAEQVQIYQNSNGVTLNNLKLKGVDQKSIIKLPATAPVSQTTAIVEISTAQNVTIKGFTIEGPGNGGGSIGFGIEVDGGGSANIKHNHITKITDNPLSGDQNGIGIEVGYQPTSQTGTANIYDNTIDDYQKGGITVDNTGSSADIEDNTIVGVGPTALIAQNGIQISNGANAKVKCNDVSGNVYTPQTVVSTGILLFNPGTVTVDDNDVHNNDVGIYSYGATGPKISNNTASHNNFNGIVLDTTTGAAVYGNTTDKNGAGDNTGMPTGDGGIALFGSTGNTIYDNESKNNTGDGIFADPTSTGNSFTHNTLGGNSNYDAEDQSTGAGTAGTGNIWLGNTGKLSSPPGLVKKNSGHHHRCHDDN